MKTVYKESDAGKQDMYQLTGSALFIPFVLITGATRLDKTRVSLNINLRILFLVHVHRKEEERCRVASRDESLLREE